MTDHHPSPPNGTDAITGERTCHDCGAANRAHAKYCASCAAHLTTTPGTALVPAPAPPAGAAGASGKTRRRALIAGGCVAILAAGYLVFHWVQSSWYSATAPVEEYFDALEARDGYEPPTNVRVGEMNLSSGRDWAGDCKNSTCYPDGDTATVDVTYDIAGQTYEGGVHVTRPATGWFRSWAVTEPRGELQINSPSGHIAAAHVAGENVPTQREGVLENNVTQLPPGQYTIDLDDHPLLDIPAVEAVVPITGPDTGTANADLETPTINPTASNTVTQLVHDRIDDCLTETKTPDPGCGITSDELLVDADTITWDLDTYPTFELRLADDPHWDDPPAEVTTTEPGKAIMKYQTLESNKDKKETVPIDASGSIDVDDNTIIYPAD